MDRRARRGHLLPGLAVKVCAEIKLLGTVLIVTMNTALLACYAGWSRGFALLNVCGGVVDFRVAL